MRHVDGFGLSIGYMSVRRIAVIGASVGLGGINRRTDVITVQRMLEQAHASPGPADGRCGRRTIGAIERLQNGVLKRPDGRIDVGGPTLRRLAEIARQFTPRGLPAAVAVPGGRASAQARPPLSLLVQAQSNQRREERQAGQLSHSFWKGHTVLPGPDVNHGLVSPTSAQLTQMLGDPTSARFTAHIATELVGPFRATGLKPALGSLRSVLMQVHHDLPDLYGLLGNNGMRVVRKARGRSSYSLHSWGVAIDFLIGGEAPPLSTTYSFRGLDALAPYFNRAGWYWGGGYRSVARKDPMHFECGAALVRSFRL